MLNLRSFWVMLTTAVFALVLPSTQAVADDAVSVGVDSGASGNSTTVTTEAEHSNSSKAESSTAPVSNARNDEKRTCTFKRSPIACTAPEGTWSNARQCWFKKLSPQPPLTDPRWEGRTEGTLWSCRPPESTDTGTAGGSTGGGAYVYWTAAGEDEPDAVNPSELAERAVDRMDLTAPEVGATPLDPDAPLLVGMNAWFWIENDDANGFGPIERTATAGPVSVTARAKVTKVVWQTGDGATVVCRNAGTPWRPALGSGASPTCGHRFDTASTDQPGGAFTVRATTHWQVDWDGAGQSGLITFTMTGTRQLRVTELQVLQTR